MYAKNRIQCVSLKLCEHAAAQKEQMSGSQCSNIFP
ncbi:hypothetical protein J2Z70_001285 [Paenibacillus silagei]|uniref:Uncharacterized protein n=1 Tax=Paenibacillus silagei TaxID=1670801 RepID=A0ABS4NNZ8_9BACL|nr:hypothetical protein [Paenibacillus silagei]